MGATIIAVVCLVYAAYAFVCIRSRDKIEHEVAQRFGHTNVSTQKGSAMVAFIALFVGLGILIWS